MSAEPLTLEQLRALPDAELDGLVDEVMGVNRRADTPEKRSLAIRAVRYDTEKSHPDGCPVAVLAIGGVEWKLPDACVANVVRDPRRKEPWVWLNREGWPWQRALEDYVAAFRFPPSRAWSTDMGACLEVLAKLRESWDVTIEADQGGSLFRLGLSEPDRWRPVISDTGEVLARLICRVGIVAMQEKTDAAG